MFNSFGRKAAVGTAVMALAMSMAACGSSDSDSGGSSGGGEDASASVKEAKATVAELSNPPALKIDPIKGEVPKGKVVAQVNCTIPQCSTGAMQEAVEALGWTHKEFDFDLTKGAQDYVRAVDAALDSKPDYLAIALNYGSAIVEKQLKRAKDEGIPVTGFAGTEMTGLALMSNGPEGLVKGGGYMGDVALADADEAVQVGVAVDPQQEGILNIAKGVKQRVEKASGGSAKNIELSFAQPQATNVSAIINFLKSNPDTDYLVFPGTAFYAGVKQGVKSAGLEGKVKFIIGYPQPSDMQAVKSGEFAGAVSGENLVARWREVDAMARLAAGETLTDDAPVGTYRVVTEENANEDGTDPADYEAAFKAAWGV
jgi:hypothetical protein